MKITTTMLLHKLQQIYPDIQLYFSDSLKNKTIDIINILPDTPDSVYKNHLYFSQTIPTVPLKDPAPSLLIVSDVFPAIPDESMIYIATCLEPAIIFNTLQFILQSFKDWDRNIHNMLIQDSDISRLISVFGQNIDVPFIIYDSSLKTLGYSMKNTDDQMFQHAASQGFLSSESYEIFVQSNVMEQLKKHEYVLYTRQNAEHDSLIYKIIINNITEGYCVFLLPDQTHVLYYQHLMHIVLENLQIFMAKDLELSARKEYIYEYVLIELLTKQIKNPSILRERLNFAQLPETGDFVLLELEADMTAQHQDFFLRTLRNTLVHAFVFKYNGRILILLTDQNTNDMLLPDTFIRKNQQFIYELDIHHINCGVSLIFHDIKQIRDASRQASFALSTGKRFQKPEKHFLLPVPEIRHHLCFYNDYRIYDYCLAQRTVADLENCVDSRILALQESDSKKGTFYIKLLCTYFENNMVKAATADALHMHRNNLLYHMNQLEAKYHIHLNETKDIIQLYISLVMLDLEKSFRNMLE